MHGKSVWRSLQLIGIALYVAFLVTSPFEHHDLSCEIKTPQHCTACAGSQLGSDPHAFVAPAAWHLADAGSADSPLVVFQGVLLAVRTPGRSPPSLLA